MARSPGQRQGGMSNRDKHIRAGRHEDKSSFFNCGVVIAYGPAVLVATLSGAYATYKGWI
jgi:hypothetical protein